MKRQAQFLRYPSTFRKGTISVKTPGDVKLSGRPNEEAKCIARTFDRVVQKVKFKEYNDENRQAWMQFGSQKTGDFYSWPAIQWCDKEYDPRFRPWYVAAAAGPRDIILVVDMSGSMKAGGSPSRRELATDAVHIANIVENKGMLIEIVCMLQGFLFFPQGIS